MIKQITWLCPLCSKNQCVNYQPYIKCDCGYSFFLKINSVAHPNQSAIDGLVEAGYPIEKINRTMIGKTYIKDQCFIQEFMRRVSSEKT